MAKGKSRPQRWSEAIQRGRDALSAIEEAKSELEGAFSDLNDLKAEYEEWQGNLPENLQNSALGEKLQAVCDLDLEQEFGELDEIESALSEAESVELPLGFGKD